MNSTVSCAQLRGAYAVVPNEAEQLRSEARVLLQGQSRDGKEPAPRKREATLVSEFLDDATVADFVNLPWRERIAVLKRLRQLHIDFRRRGF